MIYHDRPETNLLQRFTHTEKSGLFSIISSISFEVNIEKSIMDKDFFSFHRYPLPSTLFLPCPLPYRCSGIPG